jgi:hypothetical protein
LHSAGLRQAVFPTAIERICGKEFLASVILEIAGLLLCQADGSLSAIGTTSGFEGSENA